MTYFILFVAFVIKRKIPVNLLLLRPSLFFFSTVKVFSWNRGPLLSHPFESQKSISGNTMAPGDILSFYEVK